MILKWFFTFSDSDLETFSLNIWYIILAVVISMSFLFVLNFALTKGMVTCQCHCGGCDECQTITIEKSETIPCYLCDKNVNKVTKKLDAFSIILENVLIFTEGSMERRFSSEKLCEQKKGRLGSNAKASGSQLSKLHSGAHTVAKYFFWSKFLIRIFGAKIQKYQESQFRKN